MIKKNILSYFVSNVLSAAIPFFLIPIITRYLTVEEYGQVAMFLILINIFSVFVGFRCVGAATRKHYDLKSNDAVAYNINCIYVMILTLPFCFLGVYLFQSEFISYFSVPITWVYIAIASSIAIFFNELRLTQWQVRNKAIAYGFFQVSTVVVTFALSVLAVFNDFGGEGRIVAQFLSVSLMSTFAIYSLFHTRVISISRFSNLYIKDIIIFSVPLLPHLSFGLLISSYDRFLINQELGLHSAGLYMAAIQLGFALKVVFDSVNKVAVPKIYEVLSKDCIDDKQLLVKNTYIYMALLLSVFPLTFVLSEFAIKVILGQKYIVLTEFIHWVFLAQSFNGIQTLLSSYLTYSRKNATISFITVLTGLMNVPLMFWLISTHELLGVALSFALSSLIRLLLTFYFVQKEKLVPWSLGCEF